MLEERPLFTHKGDRETGSTGGGAGTHSEVDSSPQPSPAHRVARDQYQALEKPTQVRAVVLPASSASARAPPTGLNPPYILGNKLRSAPRSEQGTVHRNPGAPTKSRRQAQLTALTKRTPAPACPSSPVGRAAESMPTSPCVWGIRPAGPILGRVSTLGSKLVKMTVRHTTHS